MNWTLTQNQTSVVQLDYETMGPIYVDDISDLNKNIPLVSTKPAVISSVSAKNTSPTWINFSLSYSSITL